MRGACRSGIVEDLAATGLKDTGAPNLGGAIVTAGGLVFIAGTNDSRMRAFDARTGATLWETTLPASGHATPMTYLGPRSGTQFVAIAAGGGGYLSPTYSDALVAFSYETSCHAPLAHVLLHGRRDQRVRHVHPGGAGRRAGAAPAAEG